MLLGKVGVRFLILPKGFGLGIEVDIPAQVRADISQVAHGGCEATELHIRMGLLAALDTLYEILLVQAILGLALG
jgi:hypothetical protein